jgi:hypothetical protein
MQKNFKPSEIRLIKLWLLMYEDNFEIIFHSLRNDRHEMVKHGIDIQAAYRQVRKDKKLLGDYTDNYEYYKVLFLPSED